MKKITIIFLVVLMVFSFGCAKIKQSEIFQVLDIRILEPSRDANDGIIRILLQPLYGYSNSTNEIIVVEENWKINGISVQVCEFGTLVPTDGSFSQKWDCSSLQHFLPKNTKEIVVSGEFTALYPNGAVEAFLEEKTFPITW